MKPSPLRTTLAVLRKTIGLEQKQLAELIGCNVLTYQACELARRTIKGEMAARIATETGVNLMWLLEGDPNAPIICELGLPYTREVFELHRASMPKPAKPDGFAQYFYLATIQRVHALFRSFDHSNHSLQLLTHRLNSYLDSLTQDLLKEYPKDEEKFRQAQDVANASEVIRTFKDAAERFKLLSARAEEAPQHSTAQEDVSASVKSGSGKTRTKKSTPRKGKHSEE